MKPQSSFPHRFYREVGLEPHGNDSWVVTLDGRPARTPGRNKLLIHQTLLANEIVSEWDAQEEFINTLEMPMTRRRMAVIDAVPAQHQKWRDTVGEFMLSDLLWLSRDTPRQLDQATKNRLGSVSELAL